jgi:hypothetical protein
MTNVSKFKNVVLSILRLLTPQDLERMTATAKGLEYTENIEPIEVVGGGTIEFAASDFKNTSAKPTPTNSSVASDKKKPYVREERKKYEAPVDNVVPLNSKSGSALEAIGIHSSKTVQEEETRRKQEEDWDKPTETEFVLIERDRLRESEEKLTKQNGLELYRKSTNMKLFSVSFKDENGNDKTKTQSPYGILVNKKQA